MHIDKERIYVAKFLQKYVFNHIFDSFSFHLSLKRHPRIYGNRLQ